MLDRAKVRNSSQSLFETPPFADEAGRACVGEMKLVQRNSSLQVDAFYLRNAVETIFCLISQV